nr:hypothetical protein GCM10020241_33170 [Streptoalloteichus tenebrarius]
MRENETRSAEMDGNGSAKDRRVGKRDERSAARDERREPAPGRVGGRRQPQGVPYQSPTARDGVHRAGATGCRRGVIERVRAAVVCGEGAGRHPGTEEATGDGVVG